MVSLPKPSVDGVSIGWAEQSDTAAIKTVVDSAYTKYIERIGKPPAPMLADYTEMLKTHDIFVLRADDLDFLVGSIVLSEDAESRSMKINNLVVDQRAQGRGYGRVLMRFAEDYARSKGLKALELYTNVKMWENLGLYAKLGFEETGRRTEHGFERVFFRRDIS